jgi:hypothetical protein
MTTMPDTPARGAVRRIVTAIPAAAEVAPLLRLAARLAGQCEANVAAVLVHNEALLRLASLPVTRHLLSATGAAEPLTPQTLRLSMAAYGQRMRADLDAVCGAANVRWTLHTVADEAEAVLPVQLQSEDLLLISAQARITETWFHAEPRTEPAVAAFALATDGERARDVVAIHDGTPSGWRAVDAAVLLARTLDRSCHVVIPEAAAADLRRDMGDRLVQAGVPGDCSTVPALDPQDIATAVLRRAAGLLVLPTGLLRQPGLTEALRRLVGGP